MESASVWQEIQKQTITPADIKEDDYTHDHTATDPGHQDNVKKELNEEAYNEDCDNVDNYGDNIDNYDENNVDNYADNNDVNYDEQENDENDPDYSEYLEKDEASTVKGEVNEYEELVVDEESDLKQEYNCKLCDYTTNKRRNFAYHSFRTHKMVVKKKKIDQSFREKKYPCTLCETSFSAEENLRKHGIKVPTLHVVVFKQDNIV